MRDKCHSNKSKKLSLFADGLRNGSSFRRQWVTKTFFAKSLRILLMLTAGETLTGVSELKVKGREARNVTATKNYTFVLIIVN